MMYNQGGLHYVSTAIHRSPFFSTVMIVGASLRSSALSFSDGVYPNFFSALSERYSPATPQPITPTPTAARVLGERFLKAL